MSGGFNVKYKDLYKLSQEYKDELDDFKDAVDECSKAVADMINNESFTGATADSVKSYLSDVHITLLASMKTLAQNMQDQVALYKAGYYGIDSKTDFILGEETINSYKSCLNTQLSTIGEREKIVNDAINSIADLVYFSKPSTEGIYTSHQTLNTEMDTLKENVSNQESMTVEAIEGSTRVLLTHLKNSINLLKGKSYRMANYTPSSFFQNKDAYAMAYLSEAFYQQHKENEELYDTIWEAEEEMAEAAKERATQGVWKTIGGVALVVTGAVCIVATAGAATPIVVAGAVAGGGTVAFGVADAAEGGQEIYYGSTGNIDSKSFNVIRDTIFQGNQEAYQVTESIFAFSASALVPIGKASTVGSLTFRSGSVTVAKMGTSQVLSQYSSKKVTELTGNRAAGIIAGIAVSYGTTQTLNAFDKKFNISGLPSATQEAQSFQGKGKYPGVDQYEDVVINKGKVLYRGEPNGTEYFTTKEAIEQVGGNKEQLFQGLQVEKNPIHGYRSEMQGYVFNKNVAAAHGIVEANPQFGAGGLEQYYIPNVQEWIDKGILVKVDSIKLH